LEAGLGCAGAEAWRHERARLAFCLAMGLHTEAAGGTGWASAMAASASSTKFRPVALTQSLENSGHHSQFLIESLNPIQRTSVSTSNSPLAQCARCGAPRR
jgi:hypothetical protein